jgi:hypothetical protein
MQGVRNQVDPNGMRRVRCLREAGAGAISVGARAEARGNNTDWFRQGPEQGIYMWAAGTSSTSNDFRPATNPAHDLPLL